MMGGMGSLDPVTYSERFSSRKKYRNDNGT